MSFKINYYVSYRDQLTFFQLPWLGIWHIFSIHTPILYSYLSYPPQKICYSISLWVRHVIKLYIQYLCVGNSKTSCWIILSFSMIIHRMTCGVRSGGHLLQLITPHMMYSFSYLNSIMTENLESKILGHSAHVPCFLASLQSIR